MADLSDVVRGVASLVNAAFYPDGRVIIIPGQKPTPSAIGVPVWVSRGWPLPDAVDNAVGLKTKIPGVWISVHPLVNLTQVTSSALRRWEALPLPDATVQVAVDEIFGDITITGAGSPTLPQRLTLLLGSTPFDVPIAATDDAPTIAANLCAALLPAHPDATVSGNVVTVTTGGMIVGRIARKGTLLGETERERQAIMVTVWAPDDDIRGEAGRIARAALSDNPRLMLADGTAGNLTYRQTNDSDHFEKVGVYRRDIQYWVEFSTYIAVEGYEVTAPSISFGTSSAVP